MRMDNEKISIPEIAPWSAFHSFIGQENRLVQSEIAFNSIIMASPTDYSTIYTSMMQLQEIVNSLGYQHFTIYFDLSYLSKALEVVWSHLDGFNRVIHCMGGMLLMSVIATVGHIYGDSGIRNLLHESGLNACGTTHHMLAGKDFDRGVTGLKLVDEVLHTLVLQSFLQWCSENGRQCCMYCICNSVHVHGGK